MSDSESSQYDSSSSDSEVDEEVKDDRDPFEICPLLLFNEKLFKNKWKETFLTENQDLQSLLYKNYCDYIKQVATMLGKKESYNLEKKKVYKIIKKLFSRLNNFKLIQLFCLLTLKDWVREKGLDNPFVTVLLTSPIDLSEQFVHVISKTLKHCNILFDFACHNELDVEDEEYTEEQRIYVQDLYHYTHKSE